MNTSLSNAATECSCDVKRMPVVSNLIHSFTRPCSQVRATPGTMTISCLGQYFVTLFGVVKTNH